MGSASRRMWRRNRRRFVHHDDQGAWFDEEGTYAVCGTRVVNGIRTSEDTEQVTCPRCIKWLADQVERVLASEVEDAMLSMGALTRSVQHPLF